MKRATVLAFAELVVLGLCSCGGGGGGGAAIPLAPPAFTNLAGTRWNQTDTVSAGNTCGVGIGVTDPFVLNMLAQSGNTISVYDERDGAASARNATLSGHSLTYAGSRHSVGGCSSMTAFYTTTMNDAGTAYSGTAVITCLDSGCTVPVTVSATKM